MAGVALVARLTGDRDRLSRQATRNDLLQQEFLILNPLESIFEFTSAFLCVSHFAYAATEWTLRVLPNFSLFMTDTGFQ